MLTARLREALAVYVSASVAGSTMFVGFEKPWASELPLYSAIACHALVELVKTVTPEQLKAYGWRREGTKQKWKMPTLLSGEEFRSLFTKADADDAAAVGERNRTKKSAASAGAAVPLESAPRPARSRTERAAPSAKSVA